MWACLSIQAGDVYVKCRADERSTSFSGTKGPPLPSEGGPTGKGLGLRCEYRSVKQVQPDGCRASAGQDCILNSDAALLPMKGIRRGTAELAGLLPACCGALMPPTAAQHGPCCSSERQVSGMAAADLDELIDVPCGRDVLWDEGL